MLLDNLPQRPLVLPTFVGSPLFTDCLLLVDADLLINERETNLEAQRGLLEVKEYWGKIVFQVEKRRSPTKKRRQQGARSLADHYPVRPESVIFCDRPPDISKLPASLLSNSRKVVWLTGTLPPDKTAAQFDCVLVKQPDGSDNVEAARAGTTRFFSEWHHLHLTLFHALEASRERDKENTHK